MRAWNWNVTDSKKKKNWPDYSPIFSDMTVQRNVARFCTPSISGWNLFQPLELYTVVCKQTEITLLLYFVCSPNAPLTAHCSSYWYLLFQCIILPYKVKKQYLLKNEQMLAFGFLEQYIIQFTITCRVWFSLIFLLNLNLDSSYRQMSPLSWKNINIFQSCNVQLVLLCKIDIHKFGLYTLHMDHIRVFSISPEYTLKLISLSYMALIPPIENIPAFCCMRVLVQSFCGYFRDNLKIIST